MNPATCITRFVSTLTVIQLDAQKVRTSSRNISPQEKCQLCINVIKTMTPEASHHLKKTCRMGMGQGAEPGPPGWLLGAHQDSRGHVQTHGLPVAARQGPCSQNPPSPLLPLPLRRPLAVSPATLCLSTLAKVETI